jgi:hypothetical protein
MRRGLKIGLGVCGLVVVGGVILFAPPPPVDELAWIRKYGGRQTSSRIIREGPTTITYSSEVAYDKVPPALIAEAKRENRGNVDFVGMSYKEVYGLRNGQIVGIDPKRTSLVVIWTKNKAWPQQKWEGLLTTLGLRE